VSENENGVEGEEFELSLLEKLSIAVRGRGARVSGLCLGLAAMLVYYGVTTNTPFLIVASLLLIMLLIQLPYDSEWVKGVWRLFR
jgi:hypothetical protein